MKTVILCGGLGTRLSEETKKIPKPLVKVGKEPILVHIMEIYAKFGHKDFILALGYKKNKIVDYFKNKKLKKKFNITMVDTGLKTLTGNRLSKLKKYLENEKNFFLTYGDGVSDVDINKLYKFHLKNKKVATLTAVHPPARFGEVKLKGKLVKKFDEKSQINVGWINGGFFVFSKEIFNFLPANKKYMLERDPMTKLVKKKQLSAFAHHGFWQCMDNLRDKELLNKKWKEGKAKWI